MSASKAAVLLQLHTKLLNLMIGLSGKTDTYRLQITIGLYFFLPFFPSPLCLFSLFIGF
jgi:hypothetical protein